MLFSSIECFNLFKSAEGNDINWALLSEITQLYDYILTQQKYYLNI